MVITKGIHSVPFLLTFIIVCLLCSTAHAVFLTVRDGMGFLHLE